MEQIEASTVTKQFKRTFCEARLNELGKAVRFCLRERTVTPFRLVMGLINVMSTPKVETIADVQRAFNALCETDVQYKPFHNQLSKPQFPILMREVCCRVLDELACYVAAGLSALHRADLAAGASRQSVRTVQAHHDSRRHVLCD